MYIGKVVGTVVATRREARFQGLTLLLVRRVEVDLSEHSGVVLAVDLSLIHISEPTRPY